MTYPTFVKKKIREFCLDKPVLLVGINKGSHFLGQAQSDSKAEFSSHGLDAFAKEIGVSAYFEYCPETQEGISQISEFLLQYGAQRKHLMHSTCKQDNKGDRVFSRGNDSKLLERHNNIKKIVMNSLFKRRKKLKKDFC